MNRGEKATLFVAFLDALRFISIKWSHVAHVSHGFKFFVHLLLFITKRAIERKHAALL